MRILVVSATAKEVAPLIKKLTKLRDPGGTLITGVYKKHRVDVLITGVGMVSTAYYCAKIISDSYDFALNTGLAGSFKDDLPVGSVVNVMQDRFAELGAEDEEKLLSLKELSLAGVDEISNDLSIRNNGLSGMARVKGITVNTVHGKRSSINIVVKRFNPDVETMEGAAFLYVCKKEGLPCAQIRSVSNKVEPRNKAKWSISLAVQNLNESVIRILDSF